MNIRSNTEKIWRRLDDSTRIEILNTLRLRPIYYRKDDFNAMGISARTMISNYLREEKYKKKSQLSK